MMKAIVVVTLSFIVSACVTNTVSESERAVAENESPTFNAESVAVAPAKPQAIVICKKVKPTGSNRTRKVCRTVASLEHEQAAAREDMRVLQRQSDHLLGPRRN